jgi:hypothetical protein
MNLNSQYQDNAPRRRISLSNRLKLVLKPFKQSFGFQEKFAVAPLHRNQMRLP